MYRDISFSLPALLERFNYGRTRIGHPKLLNAQFGLFEQVVTMLSQFHALFVIMQCAFERHLPILQSCYRSFKLRKSFFKGFCFQFFPLLLEHVYAHLLLES